MVKNTGIAYEKLAQQVFEQIVNQKGVNTINIQHNLTLQGKTTLHQIDVYWEFEIGGIVYKTIVQAKDWSNPVDQGELLKFKGVLDDLPDQPRGVFVTRTGYQTGAKDIANAHGMILYEMREPRDSDWDGHIKTINIELNILSPHVASVNVIADHEWLKKERKRLALRDEEKIEVVIRGISGQMVLYDEFGNLLGVMANAVEKLFPKDMPEFSLRKSSYTFERPTFIDTEEARMPRLKLQMIEADISQRLIKREIRVDAGDMVGLILKDILTEKETLFDKNLVLHGQSSISTT